MSDSPRWCAQCKAYGDHHTDGHEDAVRAQQGKAWPPSTERKTPGPMERK